MRPVRISLLSVVMLCSVVSAVYGKEWVSGRAKLSFGVLDDKGLPVANAQVRGYFWSPYTHNAVGDQFNLTTDTNGLCVVSGEGYTDIHGVVKADGHYRTEFSISLGDKNEVEKQGVWPLENLTVTLKAIRNPISMYAKRVAMEVPEQGRSIGFDLEKGDWVVPHGSGIRADFIFEVSGVYKELLDRDSKMVLAFENALDGLQGIAVPNDGSKFQSLYETPSTGYQPNYVYEKKISRIGSERINPKPRTDKYYLFRVRSEVDDHGKLVSANYGKIYGDIHCDFKDEKTISVYFTYYFNPTPNDRNIEFDPEKNLFGGSERFAP